VHYPAAQLVEAECSVLDCYPADIRRLIYFRLASAPPHAREANKAFPVWHYQMRLRHVVCVLEIPGRVIGESQMAKRGTGKRELIDTGTDKRYVRRDKKGRFNESDDVGRSLSADRRHKAKTKVKSGSGDRGDR